MEKWEDLFPNAEKVFNLRPDGKMAGAKVVGATSTAVAATAAESAEGEAEAVAAEPPTAVVEEPAPQALTSEATPAGRETAAPAAVSEPAAGDEAGGSHKQFTPAVPAGRLLSHLWLRNVTEMPKVMQYWAAKTHATWFRDISAMRARCYGVAPYPAPAGTVELDPSRDWASVAYTRSTTVWLTPVPEDDKRDFATITTQDWEKPRRIQLYGEAAVRADRDALVWIDTDGWPVGVTDVVWPWGKERAAKPKELRVNISIGDDDLREINDALFSDRIDWSKPWTLSRDELLSERESV